MERLAGGTHPVPTLIGITCAELALAVAASTLDAALALAVQLVMFMPVVVCADLHRRWGLFRFSA